VNANGSTAVIVLAAIVPLVVLMLTSFVKVSVVLALVRNAIGAPEAPSGLVVMGVSLVLTFFVMAPVAVDMINAASKQPAGAPNGPARTGGLQPAPSPGPTTALGSGARANVAPGSTGGSNAPPVPSGSNTPAPGSLGSGASPVAAASGSAQGSVSASAAGSATTSGSAPGVGEASALAPVDVEGAVRELVPADQQPQVDRVVRSLGPLRAFLTKHASERDRETFVATSQKMGRATKGDEVWVLAPAFLSTELREAFAIAVLIFIPFLVIDLVVGLGLAALGLQTTSPQSVALPLKLLLFVSVDGWRLLFDSLLRGYV
jgi:type III secretion protein R